MANWRLSSREPITTESRRAVYCSDSGDDREGWAAVYWDERPGMGRQVRLCGPVLDCNGAALDREPTFDN